MSWRTKLRFLLTPTHGLFVELRRFPFQSAPAGVRDVFRNMPAPESGWEWFATLADAGLDPGETMDVLALMDAEECSRAAIPLIVRDRQFRAATSPYTTEFVPPLGTAETAFLMGRALAKQLSHLRLDCLNEDDAATSAFVEGLRDGGLAVARYRHFANWYDRIGEFDPFWKSRGTKLRSLVERKGRRLERDGRLRFEQIDLSCDGPRGTELYERIYARSWKVPEKHPLFIPTLLRRLGGEGVARLGIAHIDGEPAAAQIWLVRPPRATIFKLAHDPQFDSHSPGSLLTRWLLQQCLEQDGVREFDFGRGDDAYKRSWLGRRRFRYGLVAANPRTMSGLRRFIADVLPTRIARLAIVEYLKAGVRWFPGRGNRPFDHD